MTIRPAARADAHAIAHVQVETWRETFRGVLPDEYLDSMSVDTRQSSWEYRLGSRIAVKPVTLVIEDPAAGVVGFVTGGPNRDDKLESDAELYAIELLPVFQRQGLGRRLIGEFASTLHDQGYEQLAAWVLAASPTRQFFEALGGRHVGMREATVGGSSYGEAGYVWDVLDSLAHAPQG